MKKNLFNLKKGRWLLLTIFSLILGSNAAWADAVTEGFEYASDGTTVISVNSDKMGLSNGWAVVGFGNYVGIDTGTSKDLQLKSGSYVHEGTYSIGTQYSNTNTWLVCPVEVSGTLKFYARRYNSSRSLTIGLAIKDGETYAISNSSFATYTTQLGTEFTEFTVELGDDPVYVAFKPSYAYFDNVTYTPYTKPNGPALVVKDYDTGQKLTSPASYDFGLAAAGTIHYFLLTNPGTEDLDVTLSKTGNFGATLSTKTVHAGGNSHVALTVTMPEATGSSKITITPASGSGINPFEINVSGTVKDPNKMFEDFSGNALPDGWVAENVSQYSSWNFSNGYASHNSTGSSSAGTLTSPKLTFTAGETIIFKTSKYSSSTWYNPGITIKTSNDGTTWSDALATFTDDVYGEWKTRSVVISSADVKYIRFTGWYVCIDDVYGGDLPKEPKMFVTQPTSLDYGVISAATTKTFTIANTGLATLEGINVTSSNSIFAITGAPTSLAAGESAEVTITMDATTTGALSSDITVSATDMENVQFTVTGVVLPAGLFVVDFNDNALPTGWGNNASNKWSFSEGKAYCTSAAELTTPKLQFADGDMLAITITSYDDYDNNYLEITGSVDGTTWDAFTVKKFISRSQIPYGSYATLVVTDIPTTVKYLRFKGYYVRIDEIAGLTYDQNSPVMSFTAEDFAAGVVTANASKTYTVANSGTGTLTVDITSDNTNFTVEPAQLVITDTPQDFTVTFNYVDGAFGKFNANITVTPTYDATAAVTFAASATVKNPDLWDEDFEEGSLPTGWVANNWTIGTFNDYENTTKMALAPSGSTAGTLITPCLSAKANDVLTWDAYFKWADEPLIVEYSNDLNAWTPLTTIYGTENGEKGSGQVNYHKAMSFTAPADGNYYLRFTSTYQNGVDNFEGFKLNLPDHIMAITASNIPTSGSSSPSMKATKSFNATVTVKESRGVKEENVVAKFYMDSEIIGTSEVVTVEANETKQITIVATPTVAATSGAQMHIEVEYAGGSLATDEVTRYVAEFVKLELSETEEKTINTGYSAVYDQVTLTHSFAKGWNTFVAPVGVAISDIHDNAIAYSFTDYNNGELSFSKVTGTTLTVATPYIIYVPEEITEKTFTWDAPVIYSTYVGADNIKVTKKGATFQGTYAPIAAPNMEGKYGVVPATGKIAKGGTSASIKGFRAYFELPSGTSGARLSFTDVTTGITTVMDASELGDDAFNLKGQRVENLKKGSLYIIGGKKVIVK